MIDNEPILNNIELILDDLGIDYNQKGNSITFCCPLHDSDNDSSLSILLEGHTVNGLWKCWTNNCEEKHGRNLFGLVKAILNQNGYSDREVFSYLENKVGTLKTASKQDNWYKPIRLNRKKGKVYREDVRAGLIIPAQFYIDRGFSPEVLQKYDVGFCNTKGKPMFTRIVVPVYDDDYETMVGCVGRSQNPKCKSCNKYHNPEGHCPENGLEEFWAEKWINNKGFSRRDYLYNFWFAKPEIIKTGTAILVEGSPDVWRLEEAGIHVGLGIFGTKLSDNQLSLLNTLPIFNLILATDNDEAGEQARKDLDEKCGRYCNITHITTEDKDIGDTPIEEVQELFKGYL